MSISINGIAHLQMTINDRERGLPFWEQLCHFMGMSTLMRSEDTLYCIGGRTGILVRVAPEENRGETFDQDRVGLHHVCLRARQREDVDAVEELVRGLEGGRLVHPQKTDPNSPLVTTRSCLRIRTVSALRSTMSRERVTSAARDDSVQAARAPQTRYSEDGLTGE